MVDDATRLALIANVLDDTERTHTALGGIPAKEAVVNNLHGNHG